jgi:hypothetical protein
MSTMSTANGPVATPPEAPPVRPAPPPNAPRKIESLANAASEPILAGALHQARVLSWDDGKLSLGFESEFTADQVRDRMNGLRTALQAIGAGAPTVEIVVGPLPKSEKLPGTETLIEVEQRKVDEDREKRRQEALSHPARKLIDEKLGGTWKDPVVDGESET